jgi:hypothetical protein
MMYNDLPPVDRIQTVDTAMRYISPDTVQGKWYGGYNDFNRSFGWLELDLKGTDSLITGELILTEQEIHGQTKHRGVVTGEFSTGIIKLTVKFDEKTVNFAGFYQGFRMRILGCYDSATRSNSFRDPLVSSGSWEMNRQKQWQE